jgi:hypothetical protein
MFIPGNDRDVSIQGGGLILAGATNEFISTSHQTERPFNIHYLP